MTLEEILTTAIQTGATDIHIQQTHQAIHVYQRQFGLLSKMTELTPNEGLLNRIKMKANLDLSESRRTQEGQFSFTEKDKTTFIRVSIIATVKGEKVALRLLPEKHQLSLDEIGLPKTIFGQLKTAIQSTSGLILVCGATGAGKSTTLYACLEALNSGQKSIFTIEDPVEYELPGLFQCEPNPAIDLSSAALLKSLLRQDPDIIMLGEIRDAITANLAVNAALTGHLVLATLHTNSAFDAIHRCHAWQVDFFSLVSSLKLIIHQSMQYEEQSQHAVFSALKPLWSDLMPDSYDTLIHSNHLWHAMNHA
ncbi:GspE/PulE family protein [Marinomonas sp. TW1]|uniref:GspE/PulE family protein n=1 Tax=Marinomonas sp. TW1 TaxID=1561203 RepID=UPI0007AF3F22|nr:ATPase, T2SS/T4P/T4SS family [Marinomonas sp. TW1]KZN13246.1 protein transporter HofB [Marinomonas sp. TW1]